MTPFDPGCRGQLAAIRTLKRPGAAIEGPYTADVAGSRADRWVAFACIVIFIAALLGAFPAHGADGWAAIADSVDGDRWLVNVPSVSIYKNDVGTWVVTGEMRNLRAGDLNNPHQFFVGVPIKACAENSGVVRVCGIQCTEFYWQHGGGKVYDGLAYWLCYTAKAKSKAEARKHK